MYSSPPNRTRTSFAKIPEKVEELYMMSGVKKQPDVPRLMAELTALKVELLSAQCAMDRVRLQYSPHDIVMLADRQALKRVIASGEALHDFCSQIQAQMKYQDNLNRSEK
jgi:hypothetical protein